MFHIIAFLSVEGVTMADVGETSALMMGPLNTKHHFHTLN